SQTSTTPVGVSTSYAPLEQYKVGGVSFFSPATDIYSLGATFYKLVTGLTPPDANEVMELGVPALPVSLSSGSRSAIESSMKFRRQDRPQCVEEFLTLLSTPSSVASIGNKRGRRRSLWFVAASLVAIIGACTYYSFVVKYRESLQVATSLFSEEQYKEARSCFQSLLTTYPNKEAELIDWVDRCNQKIRKKLAYELEVEAEREKLVAKAKEEAAIKAAEAEAAVEAKRDKLIAEANDRLARKNGKTFSVNGFSFDMIRVDGGTFEMGAAQNQLANDDSDEKPVHSVTLSPYLIGRYEVTQALWKVVMGSIPNVNELGDNYPVENVSWNDCQEFVKELNRLTGKTFSLPTEAQWEFAARGGVESQGFMYAGSNDLDEVGWYNDDLPALYNNLHFVGENKSNELGICDMSGNVWEWCLDWYGSYSDASQSDPTGPRSGSKRIVRGGGARDSECYSLSSARGYRDADYRSSYFGFRLVLLP
ncbi:MAG: SUMF1/EgtB/PvdO family nonheme iron enzyme, partial [Phocaeicola sp.]